MGLIQLAYVVSETGRRELAVIRKILGTRKSLASKRHHARFE